MPAAVPSNRLADDLTVALEGRGTVRPADFEELLSSTSASGGKVVKHGMLPHLLWYATSSPHT